MEESKSAETTGQKIVCSGVKWSALYQESETPEHSAEADSIPAEEWTTPSNYHDSKVKNHLANEQPTLKLVATTKVNQSK